MYRFFDLPNGWNELKIYFNDKEIFSTSLFCEQGMRKFAEFLPARKQLTEFGSIPNHEADCATPALPVPVRQMVFPVKNFDDYYKRLPNRVLTRISLNFLKSAHALPALQAHRY